jgi:tRNA(Ser,Leu) C12 N-acetylase TAN1
LAKENKALTVEEQQAAEIEHLKRRLDMLDERLDHIDSMVTAVAERVTSRPITFNVTCPKCGRNVEVAIIGNYRPTV